MQTEVQKTAADKYKEELQKQVSVFQLRISFDAF